jgi:hypothetical protein
MEELKENNFVEGGETNRSHVFGEEDRLKE